MPDLRPAVDAEPDFRDEPDFFPLALAAVREQEVLHRVVGDEQIHQSVAVDVGGDDAERFAEGALDVGAGADLGERSVAVVVIEEARRRLEDARDAVETLAELVVAAEHVVRQRELDEAAQHQVEPAVVVVVEPDGARRPAGRGDTGFVGDVGEGAVAVVLVERAAPVGGDQDVWVAVVVVVGNGAAHPELAAAGDAGLVGDVGEGAVAVVLVERVLQRRLRLVEVARAAVDHEDVDPAVVVVVEERDAGPHRFRQVPVRGHRVFVDPRDAARARWNFLEQWPCRGCAGPEPRQPADCRRAGERQQPQKLPAWLSVSGWGERVGHGMRAAPDVSTAQHGQLGIVPASPRTLTGKAFHR